MDENLVQPPPAYTAYPRANTPMSYGTSEKLTRLYRGYHGMSYTILFGFLAIILTIVGFNLLSERGTIVFGEVVLIVSAVSLIATFYVSIRSGIDIGFGNNWSSGMGAVLGFLSPIVGVIMLIVMQYLAIGEMGRYGIRNRSFRGVSGADVRARVAELVAMEQASQPVYSPA